jgi:hypothetical protein
VSCASDLIFSGKGAQERRERWFSECWRARRVFIALTLRGSYARVELDLDPVGALLTARAHEQLSMLFARHGARGSIGLCGARMKLPREHAETLASGLLEFFEDPERIERHEMIA